MHDRKDDVRDVGLEALGNKASQQREWCPRGSGANASHRTVQAWMDSDGKNSQGRDPRTQEKAKEHSQLQAKEHSQLQAKEHTQPQGKELKLLVIRHSAIDKIVEMPGVVECKVPTLQSSAETATVPQVQFLTRVVDVPVRNNNEDQ